MSSQRNNADKKLDPPGYHRDHSKSNIVLAQRNNASVIDVSNAVVCLVLIVDQVAPATNHPMRKHSAHPQQQPPELNAKVFVSWLQSKLKCRACLASETAKVCDNIVNGDIDDNDECVGSDTAESNDDGG